MFIKWISVCISNASGFIDCYHQRWQQNVLFRDNLIIRLVLVSVERKFAFK